MKIRTGFVSNSSSSSFCIFGTYRKSVTELVGVLNKLAASGRIKGPSITCNLKDFDEYGFNKSWGYINEYIDCFHLANLDIRIMPQEDDEGYYVGVSYLDMKKNQTRGEFEEEVSQKLINDLPFLNPKDLKPIIGTSYE
jgi:hypothetical protein